MVTRTRIIEVDDKVEYGDLTVTNAKGLDRTHQKNQARLGGRPAPKVLQDESLKWFAAGLSNEQAMAKVGRSIKTYEAWRANTPGYATKVDTIRAKLKQNHVRQEVPDFVTFRREYMMQETFPHQMHWINLLAGEEPDANLHESCTYRPGSDKRFVLINTPPNHAKSTTITMDWVVWNICRDPTIRVVIMSAGAQLAADFLGGIKDRLTHEKYHKVADDFAPAGGWQDSKLTWSNDRIFVAGRDPTEKDPTVQVRGVGSNIYGARADIILVDDAVTVKTAGTKGAREKVLGFLRKEVATRLDPERGKLIVIGTRMSADDLYGEILRQDEAFHLWTYLAQPAILEQPTNDPKDWVTLWPERFDGVALARIMASYAEDYGDFALVYQQKSAPEDATFPSEAVHGCEVPEWRAGGVPVWLRPGGINGLYIVGGVDPAAAGFTAVVVLGIDRQTKKRYIIDIANKRGFKPHNLRQHLLHWTQLYNVKEWRIEKNGLQTLLTQDADLRAGLFSLGARLVEHHTVSVGKTGKWDPDYGVASLAPLILGGREDPKSNLLVLPGTGHSPGVRSLVEQMIQFEPGGASKTDILMALWFADLGARAQLLTGQQTHMVPNKWSTKGSLAKRRSINLRDWFDA